MKPIHFVTHFNSLSNIKEFFKNYCAIQLNILVNYIIKVTKIERNQLSISAYTRWTCSDILAATNNKWDLFW